MGQTVNLMVYTFEGSNPSAPNEFKPAAFGGVGFVATVSALPFVCHLQSNNFNCSPGLWNLSVDSPGNGLSSPAFRFARLNIVFS